MSFNPSKRYVVVRLGPVMRRIGQPVAQNIAEIRVTSSGFGESGAFEVVFYPRKATDADVLPDFACLLLAPKETLGTAEELVNMSCPKQEFNGEIANTMTLTIPPDATAPDIEYAAFLVVGFPA